MTFGLKMSWSPKWEGVAGAETLGKLTQVAVSATSLAKTRKSPDVHPQMAAEHNPSARWSTTQPERGGHTLAWEASETQAQ